MRINYKKTMIKNYQMPLTTALILIGDGAWIYVAPCVIIREGAVVADNPARFIKKCTLKTDNSIIWKLY